MPEDRALPAHAPEQRHDRSELEPHGETRALEALAGQLAVAEVLATQAHAADRETLEPLRLVAFADDELGAAAADVDDELGRLARVHMMGDAEIDEARLLHARDDVDGMAERLLGRSQERLPVAGPAQRVRADDADLVRAHVAQPLAEAA